MQALDPHTLFSIFEQGDEEIYRENKVEHLLENPFVLIGMVVNGIENFYIMDSMYGSKYRKEYERVRSSIRHKYFCKLFGYLNRVTPVEFDDIYTIGRDFETSRALNALNDMLYYFQDIEHYEKCAVIKKFTDLLIKKELEALI